MKVLFDECVQLDAIRGEYGLGLFPREVQENYRPFPEKNDWKQKEIESHATIAALCRNKIIAPYITDELKAEELRSLKFPPRKYENLFTGIHFEAAQCPLKRSKWGISMSQKMDKKDVINYCKCFFLAPSAQRIEKFISGMKENPAKNLSEFEERCLRRVNVFRAMCHGINETHYPDALHLWTAEENGMEAFLTTDKKFRNVMDRQKVDLKCVITFPSELINRFK